MSLLSNPNAIRVGIYSTWTSVWYENSIIYSTLIYTDLYINEFLNGIYYKLKMPTALPIVREIGYASVLVMTKSYIFMKNRKANIKRVHTFASSIKIRHRRILFFLRKSVRRFKLLRYLYRFVNKKKIVYIINLLIIVCCFLLLKIIIHMKK